MNILSISKGMRISTHAQILSGNVTIDVLQLPIASETGTIRTCSNISICHLCNTIDKSFSSLILGNITTIKEDIAISSQTFTDFCPFCRLKVIIADNFSIDDNFSGIPMRNKVNS